MHKILLMIVAGLLCLHQAAAQSNKDRQLLEQATQAYQTGQVELARDTLEQALPRVTGPLYEGVCRLLTLCALATDDDSGAERYAGLLLQANPYYAPTIDDPKPFVSLINTLKNNLKTTITTASQQAEALEEAPVPVTLITEEMIRLSTARNLQELLADYVPGMAIQEGDEANLSVRGNMSYQPDNILFLRNGVRMNSHWSNAIAPDFRISLANIRQVEVLRGPASSLYGNAALTAVVNIITKDGSDINGLQFSASAGNAHTLKGDLLIGRRFVESNLLMWGSIYSSYGTLWNISADSKLDNYGYPEDGYLYAGGYNRPPSYDVGLQYGWRGLTLYLSHQHGKRVPPYWGNSILYDYDSTTKYNEGKTGCSSSATIANARYMKTLRRFTIEANVYGMFEKICYNSSDTADRAIINCALRNFGADLKALYNYPHTPVGQGNILMGMQFVNDGWNTFEIEQTELAKDDYFNTYYSFEHIGINERTFSPFLQLKHSFTPRLILNAGLRYDIRHRAIGTNINNLSPRLALIWSPRLQRPTSTLNLKLAYGQSFVDLSLDNRSIYSHSDEEDVWMNPNKLDNIQLTAIYTHHPSAATQLQVESNLFYSHIEKFLQTKFEQAKYVVIGWENIVSYNRPTLKTRLSTYLQHVSNPDWTTVRKSAANSGLPHPPLNTNPNFMAHLQVSQSPLAKLWFTANLSVFSHSTFNINGVYLSNYNDPQWPSQNPEQIYTISLPATCIIDLGACYSWRNIDLKVTCKNLGNLRYRLAGEESLVLQQGRTILATATFTIGR